MKVSAAHLETMPNAHFSIDKKRAYHKSTIFNYFNCWEICHDGLYRKIGRPLKEESAKNWIDKGIQPEDLT